VIATKRIFWYLKGIMDYGLLYLKGKEFTLSTYSNADWAGCINDRKSISGGAFYLGENLVSWHNKKQESISLSIVEAEYITTISYCM